MEVAIAGEGYLDLLIMRRLLDEAGLEAGDVLWGEGRTTGKHGLVGRLAGYAAGAHYRPFFILMDLDADAACAPTRLAALAVPATPSLCLRIPVRMAEAWLIADREALADHLSLAPVRLSADPEALADPKRHIVDAARRSRSSRIRGDLPPRPGSGRAEGPGYGDVIGAFVREVWCPARASAASESLARTRGALGALAA